MVRSLAYRTFQLRQLPEPDDWGAPSRHARVQWDTAADRGGGAWEEAQFSHGREWRSDGGAEKDPFDLTGTTEWFRRGEIR